MAASERHEDERTTWRAEMAPVDPRRLVFVDESSTHASLTRLYAWAPHDQRARGQVPRNHGKNLTFVAGSSVGWRAGSVGYRGRDGYGRL